MSAHTLLIGNGLNRTLDGSCSWVKLMQNLGGDMWSEAFMSIGQSVLYQILPDVLVQVLQRVRNN